MKGLPKRADRDYRKFYQARMASQQRSAAPPPPLPPPRDTAADYMVLVDVYSGFAMGDDVHSSQLAPWIRPSSIQSVNLAELCLRSRGLLAETRRHAS